MAPFKIKKTAGGIMYKQILINPKLQTGKRGQTELTGRSSLRWRKSALDCSGIEEGAEGGLQFFNLLSLYVLSNPQHSDILTLLVQSPAIGYPDMYVRSNLQQSDILTCMSGPVPSIRISPNVLLVLPQSRRYSPDQAAMLRDVTERFLRRPSQFPRHCAPQPAAHYTDHNLNT